MAVQLRLTGVKSAYFYPPNSCCRYFFGFLWLGCLKILVLSMPESLEAIAVQKVQKCHFEFFYRILVPQTFKLTQYPVLNICMSEFISIKDFVNFKTLKCCCFSLFFLYKISRVVPTLLLARICLPKPFNFNPFGERPGRKKTREKSIVAAYKLLLVFNHSGQS